MSETRAIPELVTQFQSQNIHLDEFIVAVSGLHYGICEWGDCQYSIAQSVFETLDILEHSECDPTAVVGLPPLSSLISRPVPIEFVLDQIIETLDMCDVNHSYLESLKADLTLDRLFEVLKTQGYDLPTASSVVCQEIFATDFENTSLSDESVPSKLVSDSSYLTGLQCYLIYRIGYIENPYIAYAGF